jgi:hypothetical protein
METESFFSDKRFRWISKIYYHVTANPAYDLHPFADMVEFLNAKVGDLVWGKGGSDPHISKEKFSESLSRTLGMYNINISVSDILKSLSNDKLTNRDLVKMLSGSGSHG